MSSFDTADDCTSTVGDEATLAAGTVSVPLNRNRTKKATVIQNFLEIVVVKLNLVIAAKKMIVIARFSLKLIRP